MKKENDQVLLQHIIFELVGYTDSLQHITNLYNLTISWTKNNLSSMIGEKFV